MSDEENGNLSNNDGDQNSSGQPAWIAQLPDTLKGNETLSKFKTIGDLGSRYIEVDGKYAELSDKLAKSYIPKLGDNPTDEEILAYRQALGVPGKPEDYVLDKPQLPEGMPYDEALEKNFRDVANKLGLNNQQVQGIYKMFLDYDLSMYSEASRLIAENKEKAVNVLKNIWQGDSYSTKIEETKRTFSESLKAINIPESLGGADAVIKEFNDSGFGNHPAMIYFFNSLFSKISDDTFIKGAGSATSTKRAGTLDFSKSMPDK